MVTSTLRVIAFLTLAAAAGSSLMPSGARAREITFRPPPGEYEETVAIDVVKDEGDTVYYTLDGSEPTVLSPTLSGPVPLQEDTVIRYFVVPADGPPGSVQEAFYRIRPGVGDEGGLRTLADPPGGTYSGRVRVTLVNPEGATIYYTMDGSDPSTESGIYRSPLLLTVDTLLKFFSVDEDGSREPVREEMYRFRLAEKKVDTTPPQAWVAPLPAGYRKGDLIRLSSNEPSDIYYTLDGSAPTEGSTLYEGPFWLTQSTELSFMAVDASGNTSRVYREVYRLVSEPPVSEAHPRTGYYTSPVTVRISVTDPAAVVHFTTDGTTPTLQSPSYGGPLLVSGDTVLRFFAVDAFGNREPIREETYLFDDEAPVTVAVPPGGDYEPPVRVTLSSEASSRTHYTLDGSEPDLQSPIYFSPFSFNRPTTLKFFSVDTAGNREEVQTSRYGLVNGVWRRYARGVYLIPSVTDGTTFWMGSEGGLALYQVGSGQRSFLGENEGLTGNAVNDLILDEKGDLWVATNEGLNRYRSGSGFTSLTRDDGLPDREVLSLGVDRDGSIWAGTARGVSRVSDGLVRQTLREGDGLPGDTVLSVAVDRAGNKWFGTTKGLARYTGNRWQVFTKENGLIDNEVRTVAVDSLWNIWVGTPRGISFFDREGWTSFTREDGLPGNAVILIAPDPGGDVWVATRTGVARYSGGKWMRENPP